MAISTQPYRTAIAVAAAALAAGLLVPIQVKVSRPMLLAERFVPGGGWAEIALLTLYAGWVAWAMADPKRQAKVRRRVWAAFSIVFFGQLVLGLAGIEEMLMSGNLHLPIPAMVVAGPVYRGEPTVMLFLLAVTLVLVGPAWCSHLCYLGAWDHAFSRRRRKPQALPLWRRFVQPGALLVVVITALALGLAGAGSTVATAAGLAVGVLGVIVMAAWSRRTGAMVHCLTICPIGWIATTAGRISPFRVRIHDTCDECGACTRACRYDALSAEDIRRRKPALSCTLCGDCIGRCPRSSLQYRWLGLKPHAARAMFIVLMVALHTVTLGMAMI